MHHKPDTRLLLEVTTGARFHDEMVRSFAGA